ITVPPRLGSGGGVDSGVLPGPKTRHPAAPARRRSATSSTPASAAARRGATIQLTRRCGALSILLSFFLSGRLATSFHRLRRTQTIPVPDVPRLRRAQRRRVIVVQAVVVAEDVGGGVEIHHWHIGQDLGMNAVEGRLPRGYIRRRLLD